MTERAADTIRRFMEAGGGDDTLERLAALEHDQWVSWSRDIAATECITPERVDRWRGMWVPYAQLSEENKELDREWARKVLGVVGS